MMFIVPPHRRIAVVRALNEAGGIASGVHLTTQGAESGPGERRKRRAFILP